MRNDHATFYARHQRLTEEKLNERVTRLRNCLTAAERHQVLLAIKAEDDQAKLSEDIPEARRSA